LVVDGTDPLDFKVELAINTMRKRGLLASLDSGIDLRK
jgi:hypothetical protein